MTDRDDRQPDDRLHRSTSASELVRKGDHREADGAHPRRSDTAAHHDATDPEVPNAKRKGARRRQGSSLALSALVAGLLSIALSLLYRASERVGGASSGVRSAVTMGPVANRDQSASTAVRPLSMDERDPNGPAESPASGNRLLADEDASDRDASAPASSSLQPKGDHPASDIIRAPAF